MILDGDFSEKLRQVLSDPEAMAKITAIASGLGKTNLPESAPIADTAAEPLGNADKFNFPIPSAQAEDPRLALLTSLKPLLREDRRDRVDVLTQALTLASMMKNFRK